MAELAAGALLVADLELAVGGAVAAASEVVGLEARVRGPAVVAAAGLEIG
jgi:hypothetical protein